MQAGQETVGSVLRFYQAAKGLSTDALAESLGMSTSTYRRILSDETVVKAPAWFCLLDGLRLAPSEVAPLLPADFFPLQSAYATLSDTISPATRAFLLDHEVIAGPTQAYRDQLEATYQRTGNVGYHQYAELADIFLAELAQDGDGVRAKAEQLYQELIALDSWGGFEWQLIASIATYLPFARLQVIFNRHLRHEAATNTHWATLDDHQVNLLFRSFLDNAIQERNRQDIETAIKWIRDRPITDTDLGYRALLRLCDIVVCDMAGDVTQATTLYKRLVAALRLITDEEDSLWILVAEDLWMNLVSFQIDQLD